MKPINKFRQTLIEKGIDKELPEYVIDTIVESYNELHRNTIPLRINKEALLRPFDTKLQSQIDYIQEVNAHIKAPLFDAMLQSLLELKALKNKTNSND